MKQFWSSWQDRVEESSRQFLAVSKEQIDYYLIHKEFIYIKKRSVSNYLESEKKNLEKHFHDRTLQLLKNIEMMENSNIKNKVKEITEESLKTVLAYADSQEGRKALHSSGLKSALQGLRTSKMTYEGETLLPMFLNEIQKRIEPLKKLTKEEENKIFGLSNDQKKQLIQNDHQAKVSYLAHPPEVTSASVKNTEAYKNILARMKHRIETNFKH